MSDETRHEKQSSIFNYCNICKVHFRHDSAYMKHFKDQHPQEKPYSCPHCKRSYRLKSSFVHHMLNLHPDNVAFVPRRHLKIFICELCNTEHKGIKALEKHSLGTHKGVRTIKCADCGARFFRKSGLVRHKFGKHRNQNVTCDPMRCTICSNVFSTSDILNDHKIACEKRQELKRMRVFQTDIRKWKEMKERTICKECGLDLKSMVKLREHIRKNHPEMKGIFSCDTCGKMFVHRKSLEKHNDKYHPDEEIDPKKKYIKKEKYTCRVCGKNMSGIRKYGRHFETFHPDKKAFVCVTCGSGYANKSNMLKHAKGAHGSEFFPSTYCTKFFSLKVDLKRHENTCGKKSTRNKKKSFFCDICMKWWEGSLAWHMFNHDDYDYCGYCHFRFHKKRNPVGLSEHLAKRHPNRFDNGVDASTTPAGTVQ